MATAQRDLFRVVTFNTVFIGMRAEEALEQTVVNATVSQFAFAVGIEPSFVVITGYEDRSQPANRLLRMLQAGCADISTSTVVTYSIRTTASDAGAVLASAQFLAFDGEFQASMSEALADATGRPPECFDTAIVPESIVVEAPFAASPTPRPTLPPGEVAAAVIMTLLGVGLCIGFGIFIGRRCRSQVRPTQPDPRLTLQTPALQVVVGQPGMAPPPQAVRHTVLQVGDQQVTGYENVGYQRQVAFAAR